MSENLSQDQNFATAHFGTTSNTKILPEQQESMPMSPNNQLLQQNGNLSLSSPTKDEVLHPYQNKNGKSKKERGFFDSSVDERHNEKQVFKYIQRLEYAELERHLLETRDSFDITEIYDRSGYSPLHFAAYKNADRIAELLCNFVLGKLEGQKLSTQDDTQLNNSEDQEHTREGILREWVNTQSKGEEGFTALHFASFHGNLRLIRLLIYHGANIFSRNKQDINMIHVAAQGDQPVSLNFFRLQGLDINSRDRKQSTPLHWAAFSGAELALSYLLAWDVDVNARDTKGLTPLHLAVKSAEDVSSTRSIRHLLIKGANRNIMDNDNRLPIHIAEELRTPSIKNEIIRLLQDQQSWFGDFFMVKTPMKNTEKSLKTLLIFFGMMALSMLLLLVFVYPRSDVYWQKCFCSGSFVLSMVFGLCAWNMEPGFLKKDKDIDFMELLEQFEPNCLCPECEVIRTPRSRHCNICKRCVDRFDHHCPWINNCVGTRNHGVFYAFIFSELIYLISVILIVIFNFTKDIHTLSEGLSQTCNPLPDSQQGTNFQPHHNDLLSKTAFAILGGISFGFLFPLFFLVLVQTTNLLKGETTVERYGKRPRRGPRIPLLSSPRRKLSIDLFNDSDQDYSNNCFKNCVNMVCSRPTKSQMEILEETRAAYQVQTQRKSIDV